MIQPGVYTALVTPFQADGSLDEPGFRALVRRQIAGGVHGLVPCGTTGEAPTLTVDEQLDVVRWTVEENRGRLPVIAGIGSNATAKAITHGIKAASAGATAVLATAPYYNKPTQEGLYRHFAAIAEAVPVPVVVYDVPGRTAVRVEAETIARLAEVDGIVAVKDATGDLVHGSELVRRDLGLTLLSGDDFTTLPFCAVGGHGCISVASNVVPEAMVALVDAVRAGRLTEAQTLHARLLPLFRVLFVQTNPLPVKTAMAAMGLLDPTFRLPLCPMDDAPRGALLAELGSHVELAG